VFSLLGWGVFAPTQTKAQKTEDIALEPSFSYLLSTQNQNSKEGEVDTSKDVNILSENALLPSVSSLANNSDLVDDNGEIFSDQVSTYVIRKGDSITQIADMFGVSTNTIYWANDMKRGDKLKEGETLIILPISGAEHTIAKGDTLEKIAKKYNADVDEIAFYNDVTNSKLVVGDKIIIPDAEITSVTPTKSTSKTGSKNKEYYSSQPVKDISGYFRYPLPAGIGIRTQRKHDKYAVDFGAKTGTPVYAAASGTVVLAKGGGAWNGGYGNYIIIKHPNGTETRYAHLSKVLTSAGKQVAQGELIGYVGNTGRSTGPHLHIEVRGAINPWF